MLEKQSKVDSSRADSEGGRQLILMRTRFTLDGKIMRTTNYYMLTLSASV